VLGDRHKFLAALIVPNFERVREVAAQRSIAFEPATIDANAEIRALFQKEIDEYNADKPHHEQIRAFALLPAELTSRTARLRRPQGEAPTVETRYQSPDRSDVPGRRKPHVA
jgi:long-chain acyl-CoA synthetase